MSNIENSVNPVGDSINSGDVQINCRFEQEDSLSFLDVLTGKKYKVVAIGEQDPISSELASKHLIKTAEKILISLNKSHEKDYFWGELEVEARNGLKDLGIMNMKDILSNIDKLESIDSKYLVDIMKMILSSKGII